MKTFFVKLRLGVCMVAVLALATDLLAAPFDKQISFRQPDGTVIQLHGWGDEFQATFETLDGFTVVFDQTPKAYCYAHRGTSGDLESVGAQVHLADPEALGLVRHERKSDSVSKAQIQARHAAWESQMHVQARWEARKAVLNQTQYSPNGQILSSPVGFTTTGNKVGLTLLVDFSDDVGTIPQNEVFNYCNADNYTGFGNNGSVKQFYYDNSGGLLVYSNVVTAYVRVPQPKTYYNDTTKDAGTQGNILIKDALDALKALPNYNTAILPTLANLTVDAGNQVVALNVFFAGENSGVWAQGLWPTSYGLYMFGAQPLGNGKSVFRYQMSDMSSALTLATFCHENGHMLCDYPDVYDYDYDSVGGAGNFCLMAYSGVNSRNPSEICAYLKRASGWGTTVELTAASSLLASARAANTTGTNINQFYRYQKPGVPTEYFIIENRQKLGHDFNLPGAGLAIWHIDELGDHSNQSTNYNTSHLNYEISLQQADNRFQFERNINYGDANDLFYSGNPSSGYANVFSDTSGPRAFWWDGTPSGLRVSAISGASTNMTFIIGNGTPTNQIIGTTFSAPPPPWGNTLSVINGSNPNGYWILFVQDDKSLDSGVISNGWSVNLTSANPVGFASDSHITITPVSSVIGLGGTWSLAVAVTNYGPSIATNIAVTDVLPLGIGMSLTSSNASVGSLSQAGSTLFWNVGNLAVNAGAVMNLNFTAAITGTYTNDVTVSSATSDPNPDNDTASAVVNVAVLTPSAFASITFSGGVPTFNVTNAAGSTTAIIEASTNLIGWLPIYTNTTPFLFTDTDATNYLYRFYRTLLAP